MSEFIGHVGPAEIHDAVIERVDEQSDSLVVVLRVTDGTSSGLQIEFDEPSEIEQERALGMTLYALAELASEGGLRRFSFVNWDESDSARLDLKAANVRWSEASG